MSSTTISNNITAFQPQGYVSAANATEFLEQLSLAVKSQADSIFLVDMREVEFIDSAGLMALIKGFRLAQNLNRRFSICSLTPSVRMIFELTQLDNVFEIFETRDSFEASVSLF